MQDIHPVHEEDTKSEKLQGVLRLYQVYILRVHTAEAAVSSSSAATVCHLGQITISSHFHDLDLPKADRPSVPELV